MNYEEMMAYFEKNYGITSRDDLIDLICSKDGTNIGIFVSPIPGITKEDEPKMEECESVYQEYEPEYSDVYMPA